MLDERWSEEVEEIGGTLRKLLVKQSSPELVRTAEETNGILPGLQEELSAFGLDDLQADPELFVRIAYELGRALAPTSYVETIPILALTGISGVSYGFEGPVPADVRSVAIRRDDGVYLEPLTGVAKRSSAGDFLVEHHSSPETGEKIGDCALGDRIYRYASLIQAAKMTGAGQELLEYGLNYAREREQFGKRIGSYQGVAHRLVNAAVILDSAELLIRKAAFTALETAGGDGAPATEFAIMARAKAVEASRLVATTVHQTFGGNGFAMEYNVQLYSRRLRSWATRGKRTGGELAELGRMLLDPVRRDASRMIWHHDVGMPLPRWAREADATCNFDRPLYEPITLDNT
ncbi:acyl-CoA dehydrogenase family protein [Pseudomonas sp. NFX98]|uniref:acyl-CoA dehydrogenase family protein n=1 Tax=Pseudomonas sp. NFX98 TaxID=3399122 RepID=UPI0039FCF60F